MAAGKFDRLVTIQRRTTTASSSGHPVETWTAIGNIRRYASMRPVRGSERFAADQQVVGKEQVEFTLRYAHDISTIEPNDRIICPALELSSDIPATRSIYDITAVHEIDRRRGFKIFAERRADVR